MKGDATRRFVLDASVALAWCFADESTTRTEAILDLLANGAEAITPPIWPLEVANALLVGERRKRISVAQVTSMLRRIAALPIAVDPVRLDHAFEHVLSFARQAQLTEHDAAYVELALPENLPLPRLMTDWVAPPKTPESRGSRSEWKLRGPRSTGKGGGRECPPA